MAQKKFTSHQNFTATWTERDEAVLVDLLHRKIGELKFDIRDAQSPGVKSRLRNKRKEYKLLLKKVSGGDYNGNTIALQMAAAKANATATAVNTDRAVGKYADSYGDINFDFQGYFKKTRYFGTALPIISLVLVVAFLLVIFCGAFLPQTTVSSMEDAIGGDFRLSPLSIGYFKISAGKEDFRVPNDGNWPKGTWLNDENKLINGQVYVKEDGTTPEFVYLAADLKMNTIDITMLEVVKALFKLPIFGETRVDFIEDLKFMQGRSWYYYKFISSNPDSIKIEKGPDGKYDPATIVRAIATYGTIIFLCLTIIFAFIEIIINIIRLFSYSSRRLHAIPILMLICGVLTMICPVFLNIKVLSGEAVAGAFADYFTLYWQDFLYSETAKIAFNLLFAIFLAIPFIITLLPLFLHNRTKQPIRFVPKGNRPHTYPGQVFPTPAGAALPSAPSPKSPRKNKSLGQPPNNNNNIYTYR